jgi:hypothetical protein
MEEDMQIEKSRIDNPLKDCNLLGSKQIWVYANDSSSITPHFHYFDNIGNKTFNVDVSIKDLSICDGSWNGLEDEHRILVKWLHSSNSDLPKISNYEAVIIAWNQNNRGKEI